MTRISMFLILLFVAHAGITADGSEQVTLKANEQSDSEKSIALKNSVVQKCRLKGQRPPYNRHDYLKCLKERKENN